MNTKRLSIIVVISICFFACFYYLNQKFDRFYRISGIDNEKRQLILNHLDEGEQEYLVEHSFSTDRFMKYIELESFSLYDLTYYEIMEDSDKVFLNDDHLLTYTNHLLEKLRLTTKKNVEGHFKQLLKYGLDELFLQSENYDLSLTRLYATYKDYYLTMMVNDIDRINALNELMVEHDYIDAQKRSFLKKWQSRYTVEDLIVYLEMRQDNPWIELVEYPDSLTTVVDEEHVIASYTPEALEIPYDVSRVSFGMYLRKDATLALQQMAEACKKDIKNETFLLVKAYQSYDTVETDYQNGLTQMRGGLNEFQLGLTIDVCAMNVSYENFYQTQLCQYLKENSWRYGYVLRYDQTVNEHVYRYVGKPAAKLIYNQQITLEEYEGI